MTTTLTVVVESWRGTPAEASLAVLSQARRVADAAGATVTAAVLGDDVDAVVDAAGRAGAHTVLRVAGPAYAQYTTDTWTAALAALVAEHQPDALLLAATTYGNDLAPRLAARLGAGLVADCSSFELGADGRLTCTKYVLGNTQVVRCEVAEGLQVATVRTGVLPHADTGHGGFAVADGAVPAPTAPRTEVLERVVADSDGEVALEDARIVVAGGRAMRGPEGFDVLRDLAAAFGHDAAVGSSRPAAEAGWVPMHLEIGISGKKVAPDLYVACGISGATQHLAGMSGSKTILAINSDPEAPIFRTADIGVVGDLFEVVPALAAALRARRG
jgi:electron transfer flavoprotein alpha subunit